VFSNLETYILSISNDLDLKDSYRQLSQADSNAKETLEHLRDRDSRFLAVDEDNSFKAADNLTNAESWNTLFARLYDDKKDGDRIKWLNDHCPPKFPVNSVSASTCDGHYHSWADLHPPQGLGRSVYDWRLALPSLMLFVSERLQFIASMNADYFENPDADPGKRDELIGYRKALYKHYYNILSGIRCGGNICTEIHSGYQVESSLGGYGLYGALPLYELKALIDTLYLYTHSPQPDLTQNYHRLPNSDSPYLCLETKKRGSGLSVGMADCDGSNSQQWVYDRRIGRVRNSGSAAMGTLASGECLGVTGGVKSELGGEFILNVNVSNCTDDDRGQRWTYDPEAHVLLNAMGTALAFQWNFSVSTEPYTVWTEPYTGRVYGKDPELVAGCNELSKDKVERCLSQLPLDEDAALVAACKNTVFVPKSREQQCLSQLPKGVPNPVRYRDLAAVTWQADQKLGEIAPGVPIPFSDGMKPGEVMYKGQSRVSHNNQYELVLQTDGNLVLYQKTSDNAPLEKAVQRWMSYTKGKDVDRLVMQRDGNLVIYPFSTAKQKCPNLQICDNSIWQTGTGGHPGSHLKVQDNGEVVISYEPLDPPTVDKDKLVYSTPTWTVPQTQPQLCSRACLNGFLN
jgi:hypothetical protein